MRVESSPARITGWTGDFQYQPSVIVQPESVEDIIAVVNDPDTYPTPVRAMGSNHSTVPVGDPDGGTILDMRKLNRILEINDDTVRIESGALYIDVARELERHNLQLHQNPVIGNATVGAAASRC